MICDGVADSQIQVVLAARGEDDVKQGKFVRVDWCPPARQALLLDKSSGLVDTLDHGFENWTLDYLVAAQVSDISESTNTHFQETYR